MMKQHPSAARVTKVYHIRKMLRVCHQQTTEVELPLVDLASESTAQTLFTACHLTSLGPE